MGYTTTHTTPELRRGLQRRPVTYLRVVTTRRCPLSCAYCHSEGDSTSQRELTPEDLTQLLRVAYAEGIRKVKFLGGEPLLQSKMLAEVLRAVRPEMPDVDFSMITSGIGPKGAMERLLEAGLDRINVTFHGFTPEAFARRGGTARMHARRADFMEALIATGRPIKLNYVFSGPEDLLDLAALLAWAAAAPVVVNVLDDLGDPDASHSTIADTLRGLRGAPERTLIDEDPHSLSTTHWRWADGLQAEIKDQRLGEFAPWRACHACHARAQCREGIYALRTAGDGKLRACMDRPDLAVDLAEALRVGGERAARRAWRNLVDLT